MTVFVGDGVRVEEFCGGDMREVLKTLSEQAVGSKRKYKIAGGGGGG